MTALQGGDAAHNAIALRSVLQGEPGPYRDIVVLNAAAALVVADKADGLEQGVAKACESIDSGRAALALDRLVAVTNEPD
jgi:anthranilate phosphoribosyltransferase